jgi:hypothetical protein
MFGYSGLNVRLMAMIRATLTFEFLRVALGKYYPPMLNTKIPDRLNSFFVIPFYLQFVLVHSENCV